MDIGPNARLEQYVGRQEYDRAVRSQLSVDVANTIAHRNAEALLATGSKEDGSYLH